MHILAALLLQQPLNILIVAAILLAAWAA